VTVAALLGLRPAPADPAQGADAPDGGQPKKAHEAGPAARTAQMQKAIDKAVKYLQGKQSADGRWEGQYVEDTMPLTGICAAALLEAGVSPKDARLIKALDYLVAYTDIRVNNLPWRMQALAAAVRKGLTQYRPALTKDATLMLDSISTDGSYYSIRKENDRSPGLSLNTSLCVMAAGAALDAKAGQAPEGYWASAEKFWSLAQNDDGGWTTLFMSTGLHEDASTSIGTVAGLASLCLCLKQQGQADLADAPPVQAALAFLEKNPLFAPQALADAGRAAPAATTHPADAAAEAGASARSLLDMPRDVSLAAFNLTRAALLLNRDSIGGKDWCQTYCAALAKAQREDGSWSRPSPSAVPTAGLALLSLTVGTATP
jgi:hypothetical protein